MGQGMPVNPSLPVFENKGSGVASTNQSQVLGNITNTPALASSDWPMPVCFDLSSTSSAEMTFAIMLLQSSRRKVLDIKMRICYNKEN